MKVAVEIDFASAGLLARWAEERLPLYHRWHDALPASHSERTRLAIDILMLELVKIVGEEAIRVGKLL